MNDTPQEEHTVTSSGNSRMDWVRLILDFIARAFYPAIIVIVLMLLYPSLSQVDWPGLINRLQSASVGSTQLTFNQAEDVAITIAPLNSQLADMQRSIESLQSELPRKRPPGSIYVTHTEMAGDIYQKIGDSLARRHPNANLTVLERPSSLRRGDVQILLF